jgi:hypothetical protein
MNENQKRFRTETFTHAYTGQQIEVIADLSTYKVDKCEFGNFPSMTGFVRHVGREVVGFFGNNPVIEGRADDVIFTPAFWFEGEWRLTDGKAVRETSGTGRLWNDLEEYWQAAHKEEVA